MSALDTLLERAPVQSKEPRWKCRFVVTRVGRTRCSHCDNRREVEPGDEWMPCCVDHPTQADADAAARRQAGTAEAWGFRYVGAVPVDPL